MVVEAVKNIKEIKEFNDHRLVLRFEDKKLNLRGFVAIHNDNLGPATGGTRMFPYQNEKEALVDVLRLSRAMTYKCALAGVRHGGGKAVIIGNPGKIKNKELLKNYARVINELNGRFHTGEDVGISEDDVQVMLTESKFFIGRKGIAGDPSPYAALSTFYAIKTGIAEVFGSENLENRSVAIKGIGKVGSELMRLTLNEGAKICIADIESARVDATQKKFPKIKTVDTKDIHRQLVDVLSPCALGNDISQENIKEIHARIICGGANNQLTNNEIGDELFQRRILYVPDYVANAGGLVNVVDELEKDDYNRDRVLKRIENIKKTLSTIYLLAKQRNQPPFRIADKLAEEIFNGNSHRQS